MSTPLLPISNPETNNAKSQFNYIRSLLTRVTAYVRHALANARPWTELFDRSAFSRPVSLSDAASRARKNFSYFRVNYLTVLAIILAFSLLSHPFSLLLLASLVAAWLFLYAFRTSDQPVVVGGRTLSNRETLGILCVLTVVVIFLTSVGSLLMSTITVGLMIVTAHGAFRVPEDLFMDEREPLGSGLLSLINGAAATPAAAAAVAAPVMVSRA